MNPFARLCPLLPWLTAFVLCPIAFAGCGHSRAGSREGDVARVRLAVATDRLSNGDLTAALRALDPLPEKGDERAAALTVRGTVLRHKGLLDEAEADLEEAVKLRPKSAPAHAALAVLHDVRGDSEKGAKHHAKAVELEPGNSGYLNDLALSLQVRGKTRDAISVYQRALRAAPDDRRIRNNFGFALARAGEFSRAAHQFALAGTPAQAKNNLGYAYELAGNLPQAFEQYREAVRLDPKLERARNNLRHVAALLDRKLPPDVATEEEES